MSLSVALALCCAGTPAVARTPLETLFTEADYPAAALARRESGDVRVGLIVGADGRVTSCTILSSSGAASLDVSTCRILRARARFTPGRGSGGRPAPSRIEHTQRWVLPGA